MRSLLLVLCHIEVGGTLAFVEPVLEALCDSELRGILLVALGLLLELRDGTLERAEVSEDELRGDRVHVCCRIDELADTPGLAHDIGIGEVAHDFADGIAVADVCEELVAEAFAFVCALHEPCDIH